MSIDKISASNSKFENLRWTPYKARKLRDSIMEGQDSFIMRELEDAEVGFGKDCEDAVADAGNNAVLYAANQESTDLINEAHMEEVPLLHDSWVKMFFTSNRLE